MKLLLFFAWEIYISNWIA